MLLTLKEGRKPQPSQAWARDMHPPHEMRAQSIDRSPAYDEFIGKLAVYHKQRGTNFDPEPRVGGRHVDLLRLYNLVVEHGGYDAVSDEKLLWRKLALEFNHGGSTNMPALGFALKSCYYRQLAAYEITTYHGKVPPPKEILEDVTAKGGGLLTRTVENFRLTARKDPAVQHHEAAEDRGTPGRDRDGGDDTPGSGGRAIRGLRQAPAQRVPFQPDTQPARQRPNYNSSTSHPTHHAVPAREPQPRGYSSIHNPHASTEYMSPTVANYEPRQPTTLTLRPVPTPGHNPMDYARRMRAARLLALANSDPTRIPQGLILPGTAFDGPNIYVRCLAALRSGIPAEQDYALHHLVKISMERGDKYRFESFCGLAEALIGKVLEVGSLFYKVAWEVSYMGTESSGDPNVLDGLEGTPNILERIRRLDRLDVDENLQDANFGDALLQINEAALTIRNMVMQEENALYVSDMAPFRDMMAIVLALPDYECLVEMKHYILEIAGELTMYFTLGPKHPLYLSLLAQIQSSDRGAIMLALRAMCRISMNLEESNSLKAIPLSIIENIFDWILLDDEDLVAECLDFLYQYTAVVDNVQFLLSRIQLGPSIVQMTRLISAKARNMDKEYALGREYRRRAPSQPVNTPQDLLMQLQRLDEPERSSRWLRCIFEEDRDESVTQIVLWQLYQAVFASPGHESKPIMQAADFIKNVSSTFSEKAAAQVQSGPVQRFIVKGIRMRDVPVDFSGREYRVCKWRPQVGSVEHCRFYFMSAEEGYDHILRHHLHASSSEDEKYANTRHGELTCRWDMCMRYKHEPAVDLATLASHIRSHLPHEGRPQTHDADPATKTKASYIISPKTQLYKYQYSHVDEQGHPTGTSLSAVLVLRNLARNIPKTDLDSNNIDSGGIPWVERLFRPVYQSLFEIFAHNRVLMVQMADLLDAIGDA